MRYLLLVLVVFINGCSSFGGSKGAPYVGLNEFKNTTGQVYIYRPSSFVMGMAIPTLNVDGEDALSVRNGSYTVYNLPIGQHTFKINRNGNWAVPSFEFGVYVKEGERSFYRLSADVGNIFVVGTVGTATMNGHFWQVTEEFAVNEMRELLYSGDWP